MNFDWIGKFNDNEYICYACKLKFKVGKEIDMQEHASDKNHKKLSKSLDIYCNANYPKKLEMKEKRLNFLHDVVVENNKIREFLNDIDWS